MSERRSPGYAPPSATASDAAPDIAELVDVPMLQSMMDDFYALTHIPMSLIGLDGRVVVGAGWQDVCTRFHRVNPESCAYCIESDTVLTADIPVGEARLYRCKNGMWDAATPVVVGDRRVANVFTGQFFFADEPIDLEYFRSQAGRYGFEEKAYLAAVESVPRLSRSAVDTGLRFLTKLSGMISSLSLSYEERTRAESELENALSAQTALSEELGSERGILQAIMENTDTHLAYLDADFRFVAANSTYAQGSGHTIDELIGRNHFELFPNEENEGIFTRARETGEPVEYREKPFEFANQPWRGVTYWDWRLTPIKDADGCVQGFAFSLQDVTRSVRSRRFSEAINRLNDVVHANLDFASVLSQFVPELATAAECEFVLIALRGDDGAWSVGEMLGLPETVKGMVAGGEEVPEAREALATGRPIVASEDGEGVPLSGIVASFGVRSVLMAPLSASGRELGVVAYGYLSGPGRFDEMQLDFAGKVAASLSLALQNSRLYGTECEAARLNEALAAIDRSIHATLSPEEMFERVVVEAAEALRCESSALDFRENGRWVIRHVYRFPEGAVGKPFTDEEVPFAALAARKREPVVIDDAFADPRVDTGVQRAYNVRSVMVTPLFVQDAVLGVLFFNYHERPHAFTPGEVAFAERLSASLSLALANARLYETEHRIADQLQGALLDLPETVWGVEFAHSYHAAADAARVGGDFYDVFELDRHRIGITIGDVAGKGMEAAVQTSIAKNTIRAHATEKGKTPSHVLGLTNDVVFKRTARESFVTVFFGVLDTREGRLEYSNAGHTACAVIGVDGEVRKLSPTGPLLGAFEDVAFAQADTVMSLGDTLFLYTDGLTEARRGDEQYGEERLFEFLRSKHGATPAEVVDAVVREVVEYTGDSLRDDLALLVVRRSE